MKFLQHTTWSEVFENWRQNEGSDPDWQEVAREKGWESWVEWRSFSASQIKAAERKWEIWEIENPWLEVPKFLIGPWQGWQFRFPLALRNKVTFEDLLKIPKELKHFRDLFFEEHEDFEEEKVFEDEIELGIRNFNENSGIVDVRKNLESKEIAENLTHQNITEGLNYQKASQDLDTQNQETSEIPTSQMIGLRRPDGKIICFEGHHRAIKIALLALQNPDKKNLGQNLSDQGENLSNQNNFPKSHQNITLLTGEKNDKNDIPRKDHNLTTISQNPPLSRTKKSQILRKTPIAITNLNESDIKLLDQMLKRGTDKIAN